MCVLWGTLCSWCLGIEIQCLRILADRRSLSRNKAELHLGKMDKRNKGFFWDQDLQNSQLPGVFHQPHSQGPCPDSLAMSCSPSHFLTHTTAKPLRGERGAQ